MSFCIIMLQIADGSILPNIIKFNVTVKAVATPAYNVVVNAGSTMFTVMGRDSISNPLPSSNNSNLTVTDNSLIMLTQAELGKAVMPSCFLVF